MKTPCLLLTMALAGVLTGREAYAVGLLPYELSVLSGNDGVTVDLSFNTALLKELQGEGGSGAVFSAGDIPLIDQEGANVGALNQIEFGFVGDPSITLSVTATSGSLPVTFTVNTGTLPVGLIGPTGQANGTATVTDLNRDGATLTGLYGGKVFEALYNTGGPSVFTALLSSLSAGPGSSASGSDSAGPSVIGGPVSDMQSSMKFQLSALDRASISSFYEIVPTVPPPTTVPDSGGTLVLLGLGMSSLIASWRARGRS